MDMKALGDTIIASVKSYVTDAFAAATKRIDAVDERLTLLARVPGPRGEKGEPGATGESGTIGERGATGEPGQAGERGEKGDKGERGAAGEAIKGEPGDKGDKGDAGATGSPGEPATAGAKGDTGAPGVDGRHGKDGAAGLPGAAGRDGTHGKSAYALAVDKGYTGTELQWIESLRGKDGEPGTAGREGKDGRDGREGKDGAAGRDALEIDILPGIDQAKSYPRGTYAEHRGGTIRAIRNTDPMGDADTLEKCGWVCSMNGITGELEETTDEGRTITRTTLYTNGRKGIRETKTAVLLYRGVWREGEFTPGDVATWSGSAWHCQEKTTDKPGTSGAWKLMVKEGARGKDGKPDPTPAPREPVKLK